jgi:hypothetical protein
MLPLEDDTRAAPSTPVSVTPPDEADTSTSPLPAWAILMLPDPLRAVVAPATAAARM